MTTNTTLLALPRQVFYDSNGNPLAGGYVHTYVPGGSVPKLTWQDPAGATPNSNPITLDANGSALIYGNGNYQITTTDALGNSVPAFTGISNWFPFISSAMWPVVGAATTGAAAALLGNSVVGNIAALRASTYAPGTYTTVAGYYLGGDGGGGVYWYNAGDSTSADNGGSIIVDALNNRWYLETFGSGQYSVRQFGAKCDGSTDDTTAWNNATAAARAAAVVLYHPGGNSLYTGNLTLKNDSIRGAGSYYNPPGSPVTQDSLITFIGNNAGLTLLDANSGGFTLDKIGFQGLPGSYTGQTGLLMSDSLRVAQNEGWPTIRDCAFMSFSNGILVGNKYQTGQIWNVYIYASTVIGYQNQGSDWYHHGLQCGGGGTVASTAQLIVGTIGASATYSSGFHQFIGGAFFGAQNTVRIENSNGNKFVGCDIQNGQHNGLLLGNASTFANNNRFIACYFNGNNAAGGVRNISATSNYDINITAAARGNSIIGCRFDDAGAGGVNGPCVAASIFLDANTDVTVIQGNTFNMDMIVTPGSPAAPVAIALASAVLTSALDHNLIDGNLASYGELNQYTFKQLPVNMASIVQPYGVATVLSIEAGAAVLTSTGAAIGCSLADPGFAGRTMFITSEAPNTGNNVTAATAGAFGSGHNVATFTAGGAFLSMVSSSSTNWQILTSANVTFT